MWLQVFAGSWAKYAARHGYDIVPIDRPVDPTPRAAERSPHWQKLLILEHPALAAHDDVVWVDADILINHHTAPCIASAAPGPGIGVVSHLHAMGTGEGLDNRWNRVFWHGEGWFQGERGPSVAERYALAGLPDDAADMTNTGVLVLKPHHAAFLRQVYDAHGENPRSANEQMALSYEIFRQGLAQPIDPRFNRPWVEDIAQHYPFLFLAENRKDQTLVAHCVNAAYQNAWFLHFLADRFSRNDVLLVAQDMTARQLWGPAR